jgi:hypothetical protein
VQGAAACSCKSDVPPLRRPTLPLVAGNGAQGALVEPHATETFENTVFQPTVCVCNRQKESALDAFDQKKISGKKSRFFAGGVEQQFSRGVAFARLRFNHARDRADAHDGGVGEWLWQHGG